MLKKNLPKKKYCHLYCVIKQKLFCVEVVLVHMVGVWYCVSLSSQQCPLIRLCCTVELDVVFLQAPYTADYHTETK